MLVIFIPTLLFLIILGIFYLLGITLALTNYENTNSQKYVIKGYVDYSGEIFYRVFTKWGPFTILKGLEKGDLNSLEEAEEAVEEIKMIEDKIKVQQLSIKKA